MKSKRDHALALAAQGFRVFPLEPNGKTPAHAGVNWRKIASKDPQRVAEMWTDPVMDSELDYNIGIEPTCDLLVFDEDVSEGKEGDKSRQLLEAIYEPLPETYTVRSARGGRHRYYRTRMTVANSASKVGKHIDIKSEGGFVVGPGSITPDGEYTVETDAPIADAPRWLIDMAGAPRRRNTEAGTAPLVDLDTAEAVKRATEYLTSKASDSGTYAVAAKVKDFGVSEETCLDLMLEHWRDLRGLPKDDDHIRFRVENAYRYGQNAPGIASAEAEFDAVEIEAEAGIPTAKRRGLYLTPWGEAAPELERPYLIDGILDAGSMVVTYGDSNTGKTYVVMDQAYHIAAGVEWNGHKVQPGMVIYVAAEGGRGFFKRIAAFKAHFGDKDIPFYTAPCPIDLFAADGDAARLIRLVKDTETATGQKCALIVIDTLARAMAGGDENTSTDMGRFVANCDHVRAATGAALNVVHHTGKDKAKGARGSSALRAATDTEIEIDVGSFTIMKQRDMGKVEALRFELVPIEIGKRSDGQGVTACYVRWMAPNEFDDSVSLLAEQMLEVLERLVEAKRDELEDDSGGVKPDKSDVKIPWQEWQMSSLSCLKGTRGKRVARTTLFGLRLELSNVGRVQKDKHNQWYIP